jgi:uncharacterized protein YacL
MLHVVRVLFVVVGGVVGYLSDWFFQAHLRPWQTAVVGAGLSLCLVILERAFTRKFVTIVSVLMFGILVGFILSHLFVGALHLIPAFRPTAPEEVERDDMIQFGATIIFTFVSIITILHAKDDFKFVVPFVEFSRQGKFGASLVVDTSVLVDGRLIELFECGIVEAPILVPRFVLQELHALADSADKVRRARGRRGLEMLEKLKNSKVADVRIHEGGAAGAEGVDQKLVRLARSIDGKIVTADFNLEKVAQVQGVPVVNLNTVANAMRPPVLQGDPISVRIVKPGESPGQGVGYLDDGTMVVAEECQKRQGDTVRLVVTNILQSSVGRMVFARPAEPGTTVRETGR